MPGTARNTGSSHFSDDNNISGSCQRRDPVRERHAGIRPSSDVCGLRVCWTSGTRHVPECRRCDEMNRAKSALATRGSPAVMCCIGFDAAVLPADALLYIAEYYTCCAVRSL